MPRLAVVAVFAVAGCLVEVDYENTRFSCSDGVCPTGQVCQQGRCVPPGTPPDVDAGPDAPPPDAPIDAPPLVCQADCLPVEGFDLCLCTEDVDWPTARDACVAAGLVLARIDDRALADAVRQISTSLGGTNATSPWLGGSDLEVEGEWRWEQGGDIFWIGLDDGAAPDGRFTDFAEGEPNQFEMTEEDCLQGFEIGWNDAPCDALRPYLCGR